MCVQTSDYTGRFMEPSDYEKVSVYATHFAESNRRVAMRDFARLNVYVADGNVLQTEEQQHYVTRYLGDVKLSRHGNVRLLPWSYIIMAVATFFRPRSRSSTTFVTMVT